MVVSTANTLSPRLKGFHCPSGLLTVANRHSTLSRGFLAMASMDGCSWTAGTSHRLKGLVWHACHVRGGRQVVANRAAAAWTTTEDFRPPETTCCLFLLPQGCQLATVTVAVVVVVVALPPLGKHPAIICSARYQNNQDGGVYLGGCWLYQGKEPKNILMITFYNICPRREVISTIEY